MELQDWRERFSELYERDGVSPKGLPEELRAEYTQFCMLYEALTATGKVEVEAPRDFRSRLMARISTENLERAKPPKTGFWDLLPQVGRRMALAGAAAVLAAFLLIYPGSRAALVRMFTGELSFAPSERAAPVPAWAKQATGPITVYVQYAEGQKSAIAELTVQADVDLRFKIGENGMERHEQMMPGQQIQVNLPGGSAKNLLLSWRADDLSGKFLLIVPFGPYKPYAKLAAGDEPMGAFLGRAADASGCLILAQGELAEKPVSFTEEMPVPTAIKKGCKKPVEIFSLENGTKLIVVATK